MPTYNLKVTVEYEYEVEADSAEEAEKEGWNYDDYSYTGVVYDIDVEELPGEDE